MKNYGLELILDIHNCNPATFNRENINNFLEDLCNAIDMKREDLYWWDDTEVSEEEKQTQPHTKGTSVVQFILTSTVVIHTLDILKQVYLNIFSCKDYDPEVVKQVAIDYFGGKIVSSHVIDRV